MMQSYREHNIQELPLSSPFFRQRVERFLGENGLRMEVLDVYCVIENEAGRILAGAGIRKDIIKCIAVAQEARSEGLVAPLVSYLISLAASRGIPELKLYTKPENKAIFESLGFHVLASAPKAILMENGRGLERYCDYLRSQKGKGRCGVVVMNANPFTLGHLYLLQQAAAQVDTLFVIPVGKERQRFSYSERISMIRKAEENYFLCGSPKNQFSSAGKIVILEGSEYQISAATFPTYFLKDLSEAAETHIRLDLDLFQHHIAPALKAEVRFVGTEPDDALTNHYNTIMKELLPHVVEIPRLKSISASAVRAALDRGCFREASALCPESTWPYLLADLAGRALQLELDTPGKPGLVGPDSNGAHRDMDYSTMQKGMAALRPFWPRMAQASSAEELRQLGIEAEQAMMAATGGVNTHRGAIFCIGLILQVFCSITQSADIQQDLRKGVHLQVHRLYGKSLSESELRESASGAKDVKGAKAMADDGYRQLFEDWLPYYASGAGELKTLLRIMSTLEDTCVIKRVGYERAQEVKREADEILRFAQNDKNVAQNDGLTEMCRRYAAEGISPGGAADMLALTIFIHSIII
jgi:[citrate (pro-3S)-lyase] ligase